MNEIVRPFGERGGKEVMGASSMPEWLDKLMELWDRKDTAGYYEFKELFEKQLANEKMELVEKIEGMKEPGNCGWQCKKWRCYNQAILDVLSAFKSEIQETEEVG